MHRRYLFAYDIQSDSRRSRSARVLLDHGLRCQKSVYECQLAPAEVEPLIERLAMLIDGDTDRVLVLPEGRGARLEGLGRGAIVHDADCLMVAR